MQDVDFTVVTPRGATTEEDIPIPQVQLAGNKKVQFDVNVEKSTFFEGWDEICRKLSKLPIYEIPTTFDSNLEVRQSLPHGTL